MNSWPTSASTGLLRRELSDRYVRALARIGEHCLPRRPFERAWWSGVACITLIFDDGPETDMQAGVEVLNDAGVKGVFAPIASLVGQTGYLNAASLCSIAASGHEIASHASSHERLTEHDKSTLEAELRDSRLRLEGWVQQPVRSLVYPYGNHSRLVRAATARHYDTGFTSWHGVTQGCFNRFAVRRIPFGSYCKPGEDSSAFFANLMSRCLFDRSWLVLMIHTAVAAHDKRQTSSLRKLLRDAAASKLPVVTATQALALRPEPARAGARDL